MCRWTYPSLLTHSALTHAYSDLTSLTDDERIGNREIVAIMTNLVNHIGIIEIYELDLDLTSSTDGKRIGVGDPLI